MPDSSVICPECGKLKARAYALCWACADRVATALAGLGRGTARRAQRTASPLPRTWDKVLVNIRGSEDPDFDEVDPYGSRAAFSSDILDAWKAYGWGDEEMPYARACPIAGRRVYKPPLCYDCFLVYGKQKDGHWPRWVQGAVKFNREWRDRLSLRRQREIHLPEVLDTDELDPVKANAEWKKPWWELEHEPRARSWRDDGYGFLWLPYAPYSDDALNVEYRKGNGIPRDPAVGADLPRIKYNPYMATAGQTRDFVQDFEDRETIEEALAAVDLTRRERQVVTLYIGDRLNQDAVAAELAITRQAVSFHWRNAIAKWNEFRRVSKKPLLMYP